MSELNREDKPLHLNIDDTRVKQLTETEFDSLLGHELTEPTDYDIESVKPRKRAFGLMLVGLALSTVRKANA